MSHTLSKEPLATLKRNRLIDGKPMLGQNVIHRARSGALVVGDAVEVLERGVVHTS
jgi:uncharacterized protein YcbX